MPRRESTHRAAAQEHFVLGLDLMMAEPIVILPADADRLADVGRRVPALAPRASYLAALLRLGPRALVGSQDLDRLVVLLGDKLVPIVVNDGHEHGSALFSPDVHYVQYMKVELRRIERSAAARAMTVAVDLLGRLCRPLGFNRCVSINNWLLTTNPALCLDAHELRLLRSLLVRRFPDHALVMRDVDVRDPSVRRRYRDAGFKLVINRPVHDWTPGLLTRRARRKVNQDLALLLDARFLVSHPATLRPGDEERIALLYHKLYVEKHSVYNPRFGPAFFRTAHDTGMLRFITVASAASGEILAYGTCFDDEGQIVAATVGYDTALDPRRFPLYRLVIASMMKDTAARRTRLFLSTGAASFKLHRGTREWIEHEAVYDAHLPAPRRLPWTLFGALLEAGVAGLDTTQI
jgi:hypothetical protein